MRRGRPGRAAAARRRSGGKMAVGRASVSEMQWAGLKRLVMARAGGRCEIRDRDHPAQDVHHVVPRSLGGPDWPSNLIAICRAHHDQVDRPFVQGRLVIAPLGKGQFQWQIVRKANKWTPDPFSEFAAACARKMLAL